MTFSSNYICSFSEIKIKGEITMDPSSISRVSKSLVFIRVTDYSVFEKPM
jgi:hypothetical protein